MDLILLIESQERTRIIISNESNCDKVIHNFYRLSIGFTFGEVSKDIYLTQENESEKSKFPAFCWS